MNKFIKDKIRITIDNIGSRMKKNICEISEVKYIECGYKESAELPDIDANWKSLKRGDFVEGRDRHYWLSCEIKTPRTEENEDIVLEMITGSMGTWDLENPQGLLYLNGKIVQGFDINHRYAYLESDRQYNVLIYFYTGPICDKVEIMLNLAAVNNQIKKLYYDLKVPYDAAMCMDEDDYNHIKIIKCLEQACNLVDFRNEAVFFDSVSNAEEYIKTEFYEKECGTNDVIISYVGHTHIDVAWLWTLAQTREKVQRSYSTVLKLMERYPEYLFMSSQPQLYEYLKEEAPEIYEKVKEKIREGRWEAEGAMWLEADCNLSSGESLVRQIIHGKKFFKQEFGIDSHILWLPDVFGYNAALPQIMKKSGIDKFVTAKISRNESNRMPYDSFLWEGIDGSRVFSYFLTVRELNKNDDNGYLMEYNGQVTPSVHMGTWKYYQQKDYSNETLLTFGFGDGGGGPTEEMLETEKRLEYGIPGTPKAQMSRAGDFLERNEKQFLNICKQSGRTPLWTGEIYLEFHRGTYTSMGINKRYNRKCEFLCQSAETVSVFDMLMQNKEYPQDRLNDGWKTLLLNQFHDILPGSSIREVYDESKIQYEKLIAEVGKIKDDKLADIAHNVSKSGILVYNPNSFEVSGYAQYNGQVFYAGNIPAMGWKVTEEENISDISDSNVRVDEQEIESNNYILKFDKDMNIVSLYDKVNGREVVKAGKRFNRLSVFEDYPREFDNWEISDYYKQKEWEINDVSEKRIIRGNGFGGFEIKRNYFNSRITQKIIVYDKSRRIDVLYDVDWQENHVLLKVIFPTDIHTTKATYDIQFGNIERAAHENTSWDKAKFEVCAQKWGDLSEEDYGVSILNDCKYGYSALGGEMTLSLIKCGTYPNEDADRGRHEFMYSIYPHKGNVKRGGTIREAYLFNKPLECVCAHGMGTLPPEFSFISSKNENIIIDTVKKSEDGKGIIVRLYDAWGTKSKCTVNFGFTVKKVSVCDLTENSIYEADLQNEKCASVDVGCYEIVTLLIET